MSPPQLAGGRADATLEALIAERAGRGAGVHHGVTCLVVLALVALPLVRVPTGTRHPGMVRPAADPHPLRAAREGVVVGLHARPGQPVREGELVVAVRPAALDQRTEHLRRERERAERHAADLQRLVAHPDPASAPLDALDSTRYRQELAALHQALRESQPEADWIRAELLRARRLASDDLMAQSEVERLDSQLQRIRLADALRVQRTRVDWLRSLDEVRAELLRIDREEARLREEFRLAEIRSPVAGYVEHVQALVPGSYVLPGDEVALVVPSAELIAEVYVPPGSMGQIRLGAPVRVQVDAFRSHGWGRLHGRVSEIPNEARLLSDQAVFPVRVALDRDHVALPTGARGYLRSGMTLQAHFLLAERSLWELLRDEADRRLDPPRRTAPR